MSHPCQRCTRPVDDADICALCSRDLARALGHIPWLEQQLDIAISRQTRYAAATDGARTTDTAIVHNVAASASASHLRATLVAWCRLTHEEAGADLPADTLTAMSRHLLSRTEWLRHHPAAFDAVDEITHAVRDAQRVVDTPPNRTTFAVGPCPETGHGDAACPGEVRAFIPADEAEPARMECGCCHTVWASWQWHRAGRRILDRRAQLDARHGSVG